MTNVVRSARFVVGNAVAWEECVETDRKRGDATAFILDGFGCQRRIEEKGLDLTVPRLNLARTGLTHWTNQTDVETQKGRSPPVISS